MRRYWFNKSQLKDQNLTISGDHYHHIIEVCRLEKGRTFEAIIEEDAVYLCRVTEIGKRMAQAEIISSRRLPQLARPHFHLVISMSRYPTMDAVIEKAVEIGVKSITPVFSEFSFIKNPSQLPKQKILRWNKIVQSATQQCGRGDFMDVHNPKELNKLLQETNPNLGNSCLIAYESEENLGIHEFISQNIIQFKNEKDIWVFVGSEGGYSEGEIAQFKSLGFRPVSLGAQVLRVETACIALLSILKYEFIRSV